MSMNEFGIGPRPSRPESRRRMTREQKVDRLIATLDPERAAEIGVVSGREALEWLRKQNEYVFHGSNVRLSRLEPRPQMQYDPATGSNAPDGAPAVCAATSIDMAIFMGVLKGHGGRGAGSHSGWDGDPGKPGFYATQDILDEARDSRAPGYVHVFMKDQFTHHTGEEYRADHEVEPVYIVPVRFDDLPPGVGVAQPGPATN